MAVEGRENIYSSRDSTARTTTFYIKHPLEHIASAAATKRTSGSSVSLHGIIHPLDRKMVRLRRYEIFIPIGPVICFVPDALMHHSQLPPPYLRRRRGEYGLIALMVCPSRIVTRC